MSAAPPQRRLAPWQALFGLIVLLTFVALLAKACGDEDASTAGTPATTSTSPAEPSAETQQAVADINAQIRRRGVTFVTAGAELTTASKATLDIVAAILARRQAVRAQVQGHTDNEGDPARNLVLSERRAQAVVDYLVTKGIASSRLEPRGFGQTQPVAPNDTEDGRSRNRRVSFEPL